MTTSLQLALEDPVYKAHKVGNSYSMKGDKDLWKIAYYPLFGTYKNGNWVEFESPKALVEKPIPNGTDLREIPLHFLTLNL